MVTGFPLRKLSDREDTSRRGRVSYTFPPSSRAGSGTPDRGTASVLTMAPSQPVAASPRKCRSARSCPAVFLLAAAFICLATATASALPGGSGTSHAASSAAAAAAAAAGGGGGRMMSCTAASRKNGGSDVDGGTGVNIFGDSGFVDALGGRTRHRQDQLQGQPPPQPRLLLKGGGFRGSRRPEVGAVEALRVRGGGRPWFTGYEETTDGESSSSEEGETTDYEGSSTEHDVDTAEGEGGYTTESKSSESHDEEDEEEDDGHERSGEEGAGKEDEDESESTPPISRAKAEDIYARTVARRRALALTFRVIQRALMRTAFLLVAFQILPWLKHNFIAQCLLVGSLVLQTVTELVAIARAAETSGKQGKGGQGQEGSAAGKEAGKDGSSPTPSSSSAGLIGGIMKVFSPENEHGQHLDFVRMNDMFDKDVEALAAAVQPKLDVPNLLATGAAEGSGFPVAGMMMKAFKGFAGGRKEAGATSKGDKTKDHQKKGVKRSKAWSKKTKNRGEKAAAKDVEPERSAKRDIVDSKKSTHGAEKDVHDNDSRPTALAADNDSVTHGEARNLPSGGRPAEVENFSIEHIRYENKSKTNHETAGRQAGANSAEAGTTNSARAGEAAGVQASVAAANNNTEASGQPQKRVFVMSFRPGHGPEETEEQQMDLLSATVSFLVANGNNATDEVVVLLQSGGGEVTAFGLAATKLTRLRDSGFKLTVCVDKVAASGGYMMACVANKLVVAPFAMLGSIGVVGGMPNFSKVLKKNGVDYFHFTAGQHKSLVGPFQEVTKGNLAMQQKQMDAIHHAFKNHVHRYRPSVDVEAVGTGEVWLGQEAVELRLADEVGTAMEYLQGRMTNAQVFLVKQHKKKMGGGPSLLRALLLGPLSTAANFASSVSTIARAVKQLQGGPAGGVYGASSRPGTGGSDSLTRALLASKGYAHAAGLDGTPQRGAGAGAEQGVSGRASSFEGASVPGAAWEGGGCADLLGRSRSSDEAAGGEGSGGGWVF